MNQEALEEWLGERVPSVPPPFLALLLADVDGSTEELSLAARGEAELARALQRPGRNRDAAFHLLAADAWLTYACEAAIQDPDLQDRLEALLHHLGAGFR